MSQIKSKQVLGLFANGTVATAIGTAAKTVTISNYNLATGDTLSLSFTNGNNAATPTLSVNSGTVYNIKINGANATSGNFTLGAGARALLYFDGSAFHALDNNTGAQGITGAQGATGPTGAQGAQGTNGAQGATGPTGAQGIAGAQGVLGAQGVGGNDGANSGRWIWGGTGAPGTTSSGQFLSSTGTMDSTTISLNNVGYSGNGYTTWLTQLQTAVNSGAVVYLQAYEIGNSSKLGLWTVSSVSTSGAGATLTYNLSLTSVASSGAWQTSTQYTFSWQSNGIKGNTGAQGATGSTGPQGAQGTTGTAGAQGATGSSVTGATGAQGSQGTAGAQGNIGLQGPQGFKGDTGPIGPQGTAGAQGATGSTGPQGAQGTTGTAGAQGAQGTAGAQGATGPTGPQGAQGTAGAQGATGPTGPQGAQGTAGAQGTIGTAGPQGAQGTAGAHGANTGVWRYQGAAVVPTTNNFSTSSATLSAITKIDLSTTALSINFSTWLAGFVANRSIISIYEVGNGSILGSYNVSSIVNNGSYFSINISSGLVASGTITTNTLYAISFVNNGATGSQGANGAQGATGPTGAQGSAGTNGSQGATGPTGPQGAQGATGPTGPTGPTGSQGSAGTNGAQGTVGTAGAQGAKGAQGANGAQGATGAQGLTGPIAGTAGQVVYKNAANVASGSAGFTYDDTTGLLSTDILRVGVGFGVQSDSTYTPFGYANVIKADMNIMVTDNFMITPVPMMWDQNGYAIGWQTSSIRYKENVQDVVLNLEDFLSRSARTYTAKGSGRADIGFIAEEWVDFDEKLIGRDKEGLISTLHYDKMTPYLYEAIKTLRNEIKELKAEIALLKQ